jgi:neurotransmitter:Na+ symporter, NSS family
MGIERGWEEAHKGADIRIPRFFRFIMRYLSPLYLITIFALFVLFNVFGWNPGTGAFTPTGYVSDLVGDHPSDVARLSVGLIGVIITFFLILIAQAGRRWNAQAATRNDGGMP